jgi:Flp pilus assembly protein TadB
MGLAKLHDGHAHDWGDALAGSVPRQNSFVANTWRTEEKSDPLDFLNLFPDAVDMIVRSVRSGHPVATALGMIGREYGPARREKSFSRWWMRLNMAAP